MVTGLDIGSLIVSLGPREPDIAEIAQLRDREFIVRYDDILVTLELAEEIDRLIFSAEIGSAPPERRLAVYTTLLNYSLLWQDTGGVQMALTADGTVVQLLTLFGAEITPDLLPIVLRNFTANARLMRGYVVTGGPLQPARLPEHRFITRA
jgi:Tir chaperone protein (CesT) family